MGELWFLTACCTGYKSGSASNLGATSSWVDAVDDEGAADDKGWGRRVIERALSRLTPLLSSAAGSGG